jgi:Fe-S-cluster containining protein
VSARVPIRHPRFHWAQRDVFVRRVVADCMSHECRLIKHGDRRKLDACCQYGVDVDIGERDRIAARADEIARLLVPEAAAQAWFIGEEREDPDFPSGRHVRTSTFGDGCVFLAHDRRGCAIHRAAVEGGWDMRGTKPHVCRLFPLSYDDESIVLSDDYADYSCAFDPSAPTVYQVGREALADIFGAELVAAMDEAERSVRATHLVALG